MFHNWKQKFIEFGKAGLSQSEKDSNKTMKKRGGLQETDRRDDHCQLRDGKATHGDPVQDLQVREDNDKKSNLVDLFMR